MCENEISQLFGYKCFSVHFSKDFFQGLTSLPASSPSTSKSTQYAIKEKLD